MRSDPDSIGINDIMRGKTTADETTTREAELKDRIAELEADVARLRERLRESALTCQAMADNIRRVLAPE